MRPYHRNAFSYLPTMVYTRSAEDPAKIAPRVLPPGTILRREWHGEWHEVEVTWAGPGTLTRPRQTCDERRGHWRYIFKGRRYRSLSAIARVITGDRTYSGNRFFGLTPRKRGDAKGRAWRRLLRQQQL